MKLQAVLFDLGNTLIYPLAPWETVWPAAIAALQAALREAGYTLDADRFRAALEAYYASRDQDLREAGMDSVLRAALSVSPPPQVRHQALRAFYRRTQANWQADPQAAPLLARLRRGGLRLAVLSNAADDEDVQTLLRTFHLAPWLEFALTSAACGYRKPHPAIFQAALERLQLPPAAAAMVGDRPSADLRGARRSGLRPLYAARWAIEPLTDPALAEARAESLAQAGEILLSWRRGH